MPSNYQDYDAKCAQLSPEALQKEWEHHTRKLSAASSACTVSTLGLHVTGGISAIGIALSAPKIHRARKKRGIIAKHLKQHNVNPVTKRKEVVKTVAISGGINVAAMAVGIQGADILVAHGTEMGLGVVAENEMVVKAAVHVAVDGAVMTGEERHNQHRRMGDMASLSAHAEQKAELQVRNCEQAVYSGDNHRTEKEAHSVVICYDADAYESVKQLIAEEEILYNIMGPPPRYTKSGSPCTRSIRSSSPSHRSLESPQDIYWITSLNKTDGQAKEATDLSTEVPDTPKIALRDPSARPVPIYVRL